jgi:S-layer homology domain
MKRTYKYALSAVLGLGMAMPALAQTGFPDVKDSHWAADSVNRLKLSGLVHGFKDGEYKGDRTMTRYEMASAVYAIYAKLVCFDEEVEKKIKALEAKINSIKPDEPVTGPDLSDIKAAISSMKNDVGTMKAWGSDLAQLKKMSSAYSNELKSLGVDVKDMQKNIADVMSRLKKLEMAPGGLNITGDANFWMGASAMANRAFGIVNQDAMFIQGSNQGAGIDSLTALHEIGLNIEDKKATVPYKAEFVIGNTTNDGGGFGNQTYNPDNPYQLITSENDSVWIHELTGKYRPWNTTIGRQGMRLNKFILQRPDKTSFYMNKRWDDHTFRMDGAKMGFANDHGMLFFGQASNATNTDDLVLQPIQLRTLDVERMMGVSYDFNFSGDKGKLSASYVDFDGSGFTVFARQQLGGQPTNVITRQNVYGLDLTYDLGGMMLELGGGKSVGLGFTTNGGGTTALGSDTQNLDTLINTANSRWDVAIGSHTDDHSFKLGYRNVEANYIAPGDWGRISIFRNLTDTKAYNASGSLNLSKKIGVHGWYEKGEAIAGVGNYASWKAGVETALTSKWEADLTFEDTNFKGGFLGLANGASSKFRTLRLGYDMGAMKSFNIFWQESVLNRVNAFRGVSDTGKGSFYGFQYSVKF